MLFGLILRGLAINNNSLWCDEGCSIYYASAYPLEIPAISSFYDFHPPFYYLLLHFWMKIVQADFALRFLSVLFDVLAIMVMYWLGKILVDYKVGLISAFIFAISPLNIYYSWEVRNYTLLCLLSLLSVCFFLRILKKDNRIRSFFPYILFTYLCIYTHYCGIIVVIIENIFLFICRRKYKITIKTWITVQFVIFLLYLPWMLSLLGQSNRYMGMPMVRSSSMVNMMPKINLFFARFICVFLNYSSFYSLPSAKIWIIIVFGFLFLRGIYFLRNRPLSILFLVLYLFFPIIFYFFLIEPHKMFILKYFIGFAPAHYIFLSAGLLSLRGIRNKFIGISIFYFMVANLIAINIFSVHNIISLGRQQTENWRDLSSYIGQKAYPSDIIIIDRAKTIHPFDYYFKYPIPYIGFITSKAPGKDFEHEREIALALKMIAKKYNRIWVVYLPFIGNRNLSPQLLKKYFVLKEKGNFGVISALYENRNGEISMQSHVKANHNEMEVNPCRLRYSILQGESLYRTIDFTDSGVYTFFITAQSSNTVPFYSDIELILDGQIIESHKAYSEYPALYKAEVFVTKGEHKIQIAFAQDEYRFNKKRRLLCGEIIYMLNQNENNTKF